MDYLLQGIGLHLFQLRVTSKHGAQSLRKESFAWLGNVAAIVGPKFNYPVHDDQRPEPVPSQLNPIYTTTFFNARYDILPSRPSITNYVLFDFPLNFCALLRSSFSVGVRGVVTLSHLIYSYGDRVSVLKMLHGFR